MTTCYLALDVCGSKLSAAIVGDHGEAFGEHGLALHRNSLYREEIQVPLIFRWPGRVPDGVRVARPVSNAALAATVVLITPKLATEFFPKIDAGNFTMIVIAPEGTRIEKTAAIVGRVGPGTNRWVSSVVTRLEPSR